MGDRREVPSAEHLGLDGIGEGGGEFSLIGTLHRIDVRRGTTLVEHKPRRHPVATASPDLSVDPKYPDKKYALAAGQPSFEELLDSSSLVRGASGDVLGIAPTEKETVLDIRTETFDEYPGYSHTTFQDRSEGIQRVAPLAFLGVALLAYPPAVAALAPEAVATETTEFSSVLYSGELSTLPRAAAGTDTVVLGPFSRTHQLALADGRQIAGIELTIETTLNPAASHLGGRTLATFPGNIEALAPEIQAADRVVFFTTEGEFGALTQQEMSFIQSSMELRSRTTFVFGAIK